MFLPENVSNSLINLTFVEGKYGSIPCAAILQGESSLRKARSRGVLVFSYDESTINLELPNSASMWPIEKEDAKKTITSQSSIKKLS